MSEPAGADARPTYILVFLLSVSLLMLEIGITRVFSALVFYHFAFMAISLALFGLSAGGLLVYFRRPWRLPGLAPASLTVELARLALIFAVSSLVGFLIYSRVRVPFAEGTVASFGPLLIMFAAASLPFLSIGAALALAFDRLSARAGRLYAFNLTGSALGCFLVLPILNAIGAIQFVLLVTVLTAAAAALFMGGNGRRISAGVALATLALMVVQGVSPFISVGSWKDEVVGTALEEAERGGTATPFEVEWNGWNSYSKVTIYSSKAEFPAFGWGLSAKAPRPPVDQMYLVIDNLAATPIARFDGSDFSELDHLGYDVTASPYLIAERPRALVIGAGGGRDILTALSFGAEHVVGVEINPLIIEPIRGRFADYTGGIYRDHPRVEVQIDEGRSFVRRDPRLYDVLQISLIDTWAATAAGAYSLSENTLYTVEAIKDYMASLDEDGILSISRFLSDPPQQSLRVLSLYRQAAEELGIEPFEDHVIVTAVNTIGTCMMRKRAFERHEVVAFEQQALDRGFPILYAPGLPKPPVAIADSFHELIRTEDFAGFVERYPFDVSPCRDDRPFFFNMVRFQDSFREPEYAAGQEFNQVAVTALATLLAVVGALTAMFLLVPLTGRRRTAAADTDVSAPLSTLHWLVYFGTLGIGFMLFEVPLIQKLVLFLGHPVHATTVVLFSILLSSGAGSLWSQRLDTARFDRHVIVVAAAIALGAVWIGVVMPSWFEAWIHWAFAARVAVTIAIVAPVGFVLGMLFPLGMRAIAGSRIVPWMWGWNGSTSVLGSVFAVALAMSFGFRATFLLAAALYAAGIAFVAFAWRRQRVAASAR